MPVWFPPRKRALICELLSGSSPSNSSPCPLSGIMNHTWFPAFVELPDVNRSISTIFKRTKTVLLSPNEAPVLCRRDRGRHSGRRFSTPQLHKIVGQQDSSVPLDITC